MGFGAVERGIALTNNDLVNLNLDELWIHENARLDRDAIDTLKGFSPKQLEHLLANNYLPASFTALLIKLAHVKRFPKWAANYKGYQSVKPETVEELLPGIFYNVVTGGRKWVIYITRESLWWDEALLLARSMIGENYDPKHIRFAFKSTGPYEVPTNSKSVDSKGGVDGWTAHDDMEVYLYDRLNVPYDNPEQNYIFPRALFMSIPISLLRFLSATGEYTGEVVLSSVADPNWPMITGKNQLSVMIFIETGPNILELGSERKLKRLAHPINQDPVGLLSEHFSSFSNFRERLVDDAAIWSLLAEQVWYMSLHEAKLGVIWGDNRYGTNLQNNTIYGGNTDPDDSKLQDPTAVNWESNFTGIIIRKLELFSFLYPAVFETEILLPIINRVNDFTPEFKLIFFAKLFSNNCSHLVTHTLNQYIIEILGYFFSQGTKLSFECTENMLIIMGFLVNSISGDNYDLQKVTKRIIDIGTFRFLTIFELIKLFFSISQVFQIGFLDKVKQLIADTENLTDLERTYLLSNLKDFES